jgi:hypothetical protein
VLKIVKNFLEQHTNDARKMAIFFYQRFFWRILYCLLPITYFTINFQYVEDYMKLNANTTVLSNDLDQKQFLSATWQSWCTNSHSEKIE